MKHQGTEALLPALRHFFLHMKQTEQSIHPPSRVRLDTFDSRKGMRRGRSRCVEAGWYLVKCTFFLSPLPWPQNLKRFILRLFGGRIGRGVVIKPRVNIHFPWKLEIGDHSWIGEEAFLLNFEPISIGKHVCLSQRSFLCCGNHDYRKPDFPYRNAPIRVLNGVWIGAGSFVGPGVTLQTDAVASAGSVITKDLPAAMVCTGNPCVPVRSRWQPACRF